MCSLGSECALGLLTFCSNMPSLDYTHPREYGPGSRSWYVRILGDLCV